MTTRAFTPTHPEGPSPEAVWRGRLHLGDEPGLYGDASYVGLSAEWPLTLRRFEPADAAPGRVRLVLVAEDVRIYPPHPGHRITVARYAPADGHANEHRWTKVLLDPERERRLSADRAEIDLVLPGEVVTIHAGVRLEVDTTVHPGLCDDFVVTRISIVSTSHYATLGFHYEDTPRARRRGSSSSATSRASARGR